MVLGPPRPGRTIVISGDTRPCEEMIRFAKNADILIHEATFTSELEELSYQYGHSTALQAGQIAKEAQVKHLYLTHISPRYLNDQDILDDAIHIFPHITVAKDFDKFIVPLKK
jgi:ribonuclease Z